MNYGYNSACLAHETGSRHPESPDRLRAIKEGLKRKHGVNYITPETADKSSLKAVHDDKYIEELEEFCADGGGKWDPDTTAVEETWDAILASVGMAQWATREALKGKTGRETAFSLGRPPGHHAVEDDAMGFCFANNIALAAQTALNEGASRVSIVDFDVHHGNGTQDIFYDRDDVFFTSVHEENIYPGSGEISKTGKEGGEGATLNIPLPAGSGDVAYRTVFNEVLEPALKQYDPDVLLVSSGFDAHKHDPISRMTLTTEGYGMLAKQLQGIAEDLDIGLALVLEGGYALEVLAESIRKVHEVFDGYDPVIPDGNPSEKLISRIDRIKETHPIIE